MKLEELCAAVQEARYYNERFTRREYTSAFRTYTERFGPLYMEAVRETADCIRVSSICALVIGKMMHAAEYGICLTVTPDSRCRPEDLLLTETECTSIVGNLLENAIEELTRSSPKVREIRLGFYTRSDCNIITCEDTGDGVPEDIRARIFERGFSSKGPGRGLGLAMIRDIAQRRGGTIDLDTEPHTGTCFTLTFTKERS